VSILSSADKGKTSPALWADSGYASEYIGNNPLLKMGTELAIPKDVTAQSLGLETNMGKAILETMQDYGAYVADTTPAKSNGGIDSIEGVTAMVNASGQGSDFDSDMDKIIKATEIVNGT
jgi:hypothetical protein